MSPEWFVAMAGDEQLLAHDPAPAERDGDAPNPGLYRVLGEVGYQLLSRLVRVRVDASIDADEQELLAQHPAVVIANHTSYLDPVLTAYLCHKLFGQRIVYAGRRSVFEIPVIGWFAAPLGHVPTATADPGAPPTADGSYGHLRTVLGQGGWVGLFPEGGIPSGTEPPPIRTGFLRLAREVDAPIIALRFTGAEALGRRRADWGAVVRSLLAPAEVAIELAVVRPSDDEGDEREQADRIFQTWCRSRPEP